MPESLQAKLAAARARWRAVKAAGGVAYAVATLVAIILVSFYSDRLLVLGTPGRMAWAVALLAGLLVALAAFVVAPLLRPIPDEAVATVVEQRYPVLKERLLTTIELAHAGAGAGGVSVPMIAQLSRETENVALPLRFGDAIPLSSLRKPAIVAALALLVLVAHIVLAPDYMRVWLLRILNPSADIPIFARTLVWALPGDTVVPRGETVALSVKLGGRFADKATLHTHMDGGKWNEVDLTKPTRVRDSGGAEYQRFAFNVPDAQQTFTYYATANDGRSNPHTVRVEDRPAIMGLQLTYEYPAYTHIRSKTESTSSGNIAAPVGTRVAYIAKANKPLGSATFLENGHGLGACRVEGDTIRGQLTISRDFSYGFSLVDRNGFDGLNPAQYTVRAQPDLPPTVQVVLPGADIERTPNGTVRLALKATDDYGVSSVGIGYSIGKRAGSQPMPGGGAPAIQSSAVWNLSSLPLKAGDTVVYQAQARDNCTVPGSHVGKSPAFHIRIVGQEEMHERLDNDAAQQEEALRQLIQHQKQAQAELAQAQRNPAQRQTAEQTERAVAQEAAALAQQMQQTSQQMSDNNVGTPQEQQRRADAQQSLQALAQNQIPAAANSVQRNAMPEASRQEEAVRQELQRIAREVGKAPDAQELAQQAEQLAQAQQQLAEKAGLAAAKAQNTPASQMSPQQRAEMNTLAQQQADLRAKTQNLQEEVQQAARQASESGQPNAQALQQAAHQLQQAGVPDTQRAAQKNLQSAQPQQAADQGNQAARDLQQLAKNLDQNGQQNAQALDQRANQMEQLANKLNQMAAAQEQVANTARNNPDAQSSQRLGQQESGLQQQAEQASRQLPDASQAQRQVQRAQQHMQQAGQSLNQANPQEATPPAQQAAQELRSAAEEARDIASALRQQQQAEAAQHAAEQLAAEQRALERQTAAMNDAANGQPITTPEQRKKVDALAQRQQQLADRSQKVRDQMPNDAFRSAAEMATSHMWSANDSIRRPDVGAETQGHQEHAAQTLERIARALEQQAQAAQAQAQNSGQMTQGDQQMMQSMGQLQLAREMEAQIQQETTSLDRQRDQNPNRNLSSAQERQVNRLSDAQQRNRQLGDRLLDQFRSKPEMGDNVRKARDQMEDVRNNLSQRETGGQTQEREQRIVGLLDQALNQGKQAMRQQRQQMAQAQQQQQQSQQSSQRRDRGNQPAPRTTAPITQAQAGAFGQVNMRGRGFGFLSPRAQQSMREGQGEQVPAEYQELVKQYYRALSERGR